jgi:hypothetical protein
MFRRREDLPWLGAEALPGGLTEIHRVNQVWLDAAARQQRYVKELRDRGFLSIAEHGTKQGVLSAG